MRMLIKDNKWITSFENITITFDVEYGDEISDISFFYEGKRVHIKSNDIDKTFRYLEKIFNVRYKI